jgi:hypothetical protein
VHRAAGQGGSYRSIVTPFSPEIHERHFSEAISPTAFSGRVHRPEFENADPKGGL